jgi:hypothetical protein
MVAVAFPRRTRTLIGALAVMVCVGAAVPAVPGNAGASSDRDRLAARLLRLDPAARVGGNTQVAAPAGTTLVGVRGRVNFILGLARRQRIVGGNGHDQLGARGHRARVHGAGGPDLIHGGRGAQRLHGGHGHDRIHAGHGHDMIRGGHGHDRIHGSHGHDRIHGGHGHDRIHGGAGRDRLEGGAGRDRLIDRQGATIAVAGPGDSVDVADGDSDRVACAAGSTNRIVVDRDDRLHPSCRGPAASVSYRRPPDGALTADAPAARAAQQPPITGSGSNADPYTAECVDPQNVDCTTPLFAARSLTGLWANEYVPAYKSPTSHPYMYNRSYAPQGTVLPPGVGVLGLGPIGMNITGIETRQDVEFDATRVYALGTLTGGLNSSATNWELDTNSYQVQLHCTSERTHAHRWVVG